MAILQIKSVLVDVDGIHRPGLAIVRRRQTAGRRLVENKCVDEGAVLGVEEDRGRRIFY